MKVIRKTQSKSVDYTRCIVVIDRYAWYCIIGVSLSMYSSAFYQGHDSGGECNIPYINRFAMPRPGPDQPWWVSHKTAFDNLINL